MESAAHTLEGRLADVRGQIAAACARAGRSPEGVTLVAVTKTHPASVVQAAIDAGLRDFGENRIEEAAGKMTEIEAATDAAVRWHMIGHVQSRKARYVTHGYALLHSLDSLHLAERLDRYLTDQGQTLDVLLQMNVSGEATKEGFDAYQWERRATQRDAVWADVAALLALPGLRIRGLMTMAPLVDDPEATRPVFRALRGLRDALADDFPAANWDTLSMGMSDDYPVAVEEGATLVRLGRALFGQRPYT